MNMSVELSAICGLNDADGIETCNDNLSVAEGFAVYIKNPLAFHIIDFTPSDKNGKLSNCFVSAVNYAYRLAEHLGCDVNTAIGEHSVYDLFFASKK